ncbi:DNA-binding transcriptional regulator, LysR family [Amycolatopsis sacchari]|uniref:DNA-binding transcriptional regulator, LysR family n=1 Tax=Amycolatopsis sacchari TaxID=115433 RepID=A0A1I3QBK0_9PSEU|nr:DNA-binding transcriptional regulator, LysR family [Amycolatopsis sacchari]
MRYFTVVAEHENFGRAATALHLAQPSLSRQIQRLEDLLGVRLLDRGPQGSSLTDAGRAFLPQARALLHTAREATLAARAAAPRPTLTIGYIEDFVVTPVVRELRHRHPGARITARHLDWHAAGALLEHEVDALVARLPMALPAAQVQVTVLYEEPFVLVVPAFHRLAGKESVWLDDLVGEGLVTCRQTGAAFTPPEDVTVVESIEDKLERVAEGRASGLLPAGDRRLALRPDLVAIPVEDAEPCRVVVATRAADPNPLLPAFRAAAKAHLTAAA